MSGESYHSELREEFGLSPMPRFIDAQPPREPNLDEVRAYHAGELDHERNAEVRGLIIRYEGWNALSRQVLDERAEEYRERDALPISGDEPGAIGPASSQKRAWGVSHRRVLALSAVLTIGMLLAIGLLVWNNGGNSEIVASIDDNPFGRLTKDADGNVAGVKSYPGRWRSQIESIMRKERVTLPEKTEDRIATLRRTRGVGRQTKYVSPVATIVRSQTPTFRWREDREDDKYEVVVYMVRDDLDQNPIVARSRKLATLRWTISLALERGKLYEWRIFLHHNGARDFWDEPPPRFQVLDEMRSLQLAKMERDSQGSHLLLALIYLDYGLLDDAERELRHLVEANRDSAIAKSLLTSLTSLASGG